MGNWMLASNCYETLACKTISSALLLLSAATEAEINSWGTHDGIIRVGRLTSSVAPIGTIVVVKVAHSFSIPFGLSFFSVNRNLSVALGSITQGTNLCACSSGSGIPHQYGISTASSSPWGSASSAGSSSRHVEGLPCKVVGWVFVITSYQKVLRNMAIAVKHGETTGLTSCSKFGF